MQLDPGVARAERNLALAVELSNDAIFDVALDGTVLSWNPAAERMYGYTSAEVIGRSVTMLVPPDRMCESLEFLERLAAGERIDRFETVRLRKSGEHVDVALTIGPKANEGGSIEGATAVVHEVTSWSLEEQRLRDLGAIVDSSNDAIVGKRLDGTITSWNVAAERMYGYTAAEMIGGSIAKLVPKDKPDELPQILERLRAGERIEHLETIRVRKDGKHIDVSLVISPIRHGRSIVGASTIAHDISGRNQSQRESREIAGLLEAIEASAPVGLGYVDRDFRIVRLNETLAAIHGGTIDEQIGRTVSEAAPELWPDLERAYKTVFETGKPLIGRELAGPCAVAGGERRCWLTSFHPVRVGGEISGIGIVAFDITERKLAEEELRTAKDDAERLIETSNAIVLVLDGDLNVKAINKAGEEITGYSREELQGRSWDIVVPRDRYPAVWRAFATLMSESGPERFENPILTKAGEERIVLWRISRTLERGEVTGTVSFGVDVTESVRGREKAEWDHALLRIADEERRALLNRLVHAQEEERDRIAGEIHDDPVQALAVVGMSLELFARDVEDPLLLSKLSEAREVVRMASVSLRQMVFRLHPLRLDREGLANAFHDQLEQIRQEARIDVSLENTLTEEPPVATSTIAFRIAQEALMNVRKHANAQHLHVFLGESAGGIVVRVTDDGRGFQQTASEPGHLGLVSMRERAEMAGGLFRVDSELGRGTTVEFFLPPIAV